MLPRPTIAALLQKAKLLFTNGEIYDKYNNYFVLYLSSHLIFYKSAKYINANWMYLEQEK